jgi:hypothetical protein
VNKGFRYDLFDMASLLSSILKQPVSKTIKNNRNDFNVKTFNFNLISMYLLFEDAKQSIMLFSKIY